MKIKCIKSGFTGVTKDKEYSVVVRGDKFYTIRNDYRHLKDYPKQLFIEV